MEQMVARQAHNLEAGGSIPPPATMNDDPRYYGLRHNGQHVDHAPSITHHNPHTMDRKEFLKTVSETFKSNPKVEKFWVTSDAMCFVHESVARNHAKMLGPHGGVECITRESIERFESGKPATGKPKPGALPEVGDGGEERTAEGSGEDMTEQTGDVLEENGGGAAAGEETAGTEGGRPDEQPAATAKKTAVKKAASKKKTAKKK